MLESATLPGRARLISATTARATGQCQKQCERAADEGLVWVSTHTGRVSCPRGRSWPPTPAIPLTETPQHLLDLVVPSCDP